MSNHTLRSPLSFCFMNRKSFCQYISPLTALIWNIVLLYICFIICRVAFLLENRAMFSQDLDFSELVTIFVGGLRFDTAAILYTNALYVLLVLFPIHYKESRIYRNIAKWIFVVTNSIAIISNLCDCVYFKYTGRRTTATVFKEFSNENNLTTIFGREIINHWYLFLLAVVMIAGLIKLYRDYSKVENRRNRIYYPIQTLLLLAVLPFFIAGMRGGFTTATRPITVSNANQYVSRPVEAAIVLNTPFAIYRTIGKNVFTVPKYYTDRNEMMRYFTPVHVPSDTVQFKPKNVVVFILESFGKEYVGAFNKSLLGEDYGYTPFLDSLITRSMVFEYSFANGRKSIDGMPSVLSGIPMFVEPFFLTPSSLNKVTSIGGELAKKGYYTAFFHGADNSSMGFQAYSRACGYQHYFGRDDYNNDKDFDGTWAIWDREFFQYYADEISKMPQPFSVGLFSASSHHPYKIPERDKDKYPEGTLPIHKCIRYTDNALREFFEKASHTDWYNNTLFVLVADHTNLSNTPEYMTDAGQFSIPVIFFCPGDSTLTGCRKGISQQIDIMPTVLGYLGYDRPYISFGCDLLHTPADETFAVNYIGGVYQYFKGDYMLQFNGEKSIALYDFVHDPLLSRNILEGNDSIAGDMEHRVKSIIQQYMERMTGDSLTYSKDK